MASLRDGWDETRNIMGMLHNIGGLSGSQQGIERREGPAPHKPHRSPGNLSDRLEISDEALRLAGIDEGPNARIDRVRREIADGTYESDHKLDTTVNRLFTDLAAFDLRV